MIPSLARTSGSTVPTSTWLYLSTFTQQLEISQIATVDNPTYFGNTTALRLVVNAHCICVTTVPTLLSLLRLGTKASWPSSLRRGPREKEGKEKLTGPIAAELVGLVAELLAEVAVFVVEVVAESSCRSPWGFANGGWRTRRKRSRKSAIVLRGSKSSSCRKHLKQRFWGESWDEESLYVLHVITTKLWTLKKLEISSVN